MATDKLLDDEAEKFLNQPVRQLEPGKLYISEVRVGKLVMRKYAIVPNNGDPVEIITQAMGAK